MDSSRAAWSGASGRAGRRRVWTGLDQGPRLRRRAVTSPPPSPGRCGPVARLGRWRPAGPGGTGPSCRVPSESNPLYPPGLLQSIPPTACQPQGPDCVRACRLGVAASADPVNGPPAAGSRLCPSLPARRCCFSRSRQRPASRRVPTVSEPAGSEVLLQSIPSTARQPQGPDCVRVSQPGSVIALVSSTARRPQFPD